MCLNIGTSINHHFPFGISGKVVGLGVPILKHFRVDLFLGRLGPPGEQTGSHENDFPLKILQYYDT